MVSIYTESFLGCTFHTYYTTTLTKCRQKTIDPFLEQGKKKKKQKKEGWFFFSELQIELMAIRDRGEKSEKVKDIFQTFSFFCQFGPHRLATLFLLVDAGSCCLDWAVEVATLMRPLARVTERENKCNS